MRRPATMPAPFDTFRTKFFRKRILSVTPRSSRILVQSSRQPHHSNRSGGKGGYPFAVDRNPPLQAFTNRKLPNSPITQLLNFPITQSPLRSSHVLLP